MWWRSLLSIFLGLSGLLSATTSARASLYSDTLPGTHKVVLLDESTGVERWQVDARKIHLISEGGVLVSRFWSGPQARLRWIDLATGTERWAVPGSHRISGTHGETRLGERLYRIFEPCSPSDRRDGSCEDPSGVETLHVATGETGAFWPFPLEIHSFLFGVGERLLLLDYPELNAGVRIRLLASDGHLLFQRTVENVRYGGNPDLAVIPIPERQLAVVRLDLGGAVRLLALEVADGTIAWETLLADQPGSIVHAGERLWVSGDERLRILDPATGELVAERETGRRRGMAPGDLSSFVGVVGDDAYILDATTLEPRWEGPLPPRTLGTMLEPLPRLERVRARTKAWIDGTSAYTHRSEVLTRVGLREGRVDWRRRIGAPPRHPMGSESWARLAAGEDTVLLSRRGLLQGFAKEDGAHLWTMVDDRGDLPQVHPTRHGVLTTRFDADRPRVPSDIGLLSHTGIGRRILTANAALALLCIGLAMSVYGRSWPWTAAFALTLGAEVWALDAVAIGAASLAVATVVSITRSLRGGRERAVVPPSLRTTATGALYFGLLGLAIGAYLFIDDGGGRILRSAGGALELANHLRYQVLIHDPQVRALHYRFLATWTGGFAAAYLAATSLRSPRDPITGQWRSPIALRRSVAIVGGGMFGLLALGALSLSHDAFDRAAAQVEAAAQNEAIALHHVRNPMSNFGEEDRVRVFALEHARAGTAASDRIARAFVDLLPPEVAIPIAREMIEHWHANPEHPSGSGRALPILHDHDPEEARSAALLALRGTSAPSLYAHSYAAGFLGRYPDTEVVEALISGMEDYRPYYDQAEKRFRMPYSNTTLMFEQSLEELTFQPYQSDLEAWRRWWEEAGSLEANRGSWALQACDAALERVTHTDMMTRYSALRVLGQFLDIGPENSDDPELLRTFQTSLEAWWGEHREERADTIRAAGRAVPLMDY